MKKQNVHESIIWDYRNSKLEQQATHLLLGISPNQGIIMKEQNEYVK